MRRKRDTLKNVLLIGDLVGHEKVALAAMIPVLSNMGLDVSNLPTAVVSNAFDYGEIALEDTTEYMKKANETWKKLGFKYDMIFIGYINSWEQVNIIKDIIAYNDYPLVVADPIMGDLGELYIGLTEEVVKFTKEMMNNADLIIPNLTEAAILLDEDPKKDVSGEELESWLKRLAKSNRSVVITSVGLDGKNYVYGIDNMDHQGKIFKVEYEEVPFRFGGTGDIFSSLVFGRLALGDKLEEAVAFTCDFMTKILKQEIEDEKGAISVRIENYLQYLHE